MVICSFCQKKCKNPKQCSVCKVAVYCSAKCQKLSWTKGHRRTCKKVEQIGDTISEVGSVPDAPEWERILLMIPHVDAMLACHNTYEDQIAIIFTFVSALRSYGLTTGSHDRIFEMIPLEMRRAVLEGEQKMFRDQGETLNFIADCSMIIENDEQAMEYFEKSRKVGEAHGFFGIESRACRGIGSLLILKGRVDDGMDLLRNALAAAPLAEVDCSNLEAVALETLIYHLLGMPGEWDDTQQAEVDNLTLRYCSLAEGMVCEVPAPVNSVLFNMFSYFLRTRYLWRCGDDVNAAVYLRKILGLLKNVSMEDEHDLLHRRPYVEQAERVIENIEFRCFHADTVDTFEGIVADFQSEIARLMG